ncbi:MAG: T9SS type A sorting domain-containing protein [Bacteroidota bacterium]
MKRLLLLNTLLLLSCAVFSQIYYVDNATPNQINVDNPPYDVDDNTALITGGNAISDVYVDEANSLIYWVNSGNGTIGRANLDGTGVNQSFVTTAANPNKMTVGNSFIYYTHTNGDIGRANESNGLGVNNAYVTDANGPEGIVVRSSIIVWTNSGDGTIKVSVAGSIAGPSVTVVTGEPGATELEVDNVGNLYWLDTTNNTIERGVPNIFLGGFDKEVLVTGVNATTFHLDLDEDLIIWNQASNILGSAELDGSNENLSFLDLGFDVSLGLYTNINLGISFSPGYAGLEFQLCPGSSQDFDSFLSLSDCDLDGDATYELSLRNVNSGNYSETITKDGCDLDVNIGTAGAPSRGLFDLVCTIQDPDGVDASGLSGVIASTSTSVTFDLGNMEIQTYTSYSYANDASLEVAADARSLEFAPLAGTTPIIGKNLTELSTESYSVIIGYQDLGDGGISTDIETVEIRVLDPNGIDEYNPFVLGPVFLSNGQQFNFVNGTGGGASFGIQHVSGTADIVIRCTVTSCGLTRVFTRSVAVQLPVELVSFDAQRADKAVILNWKTAQEINNEGFQVEHSTDGKDWTKLGFVAGYGDTNDNKTYEYKHDAPTTGENYYRLKQMDYDGQFEYSDIRVVEFGRSQTTMLPIFPNPAKDGFLNLNLDNYSGGEVLIQIYDTAGKLWLQQSSFSANNALSVSGFVAGIYIVETIVDGQSLRQKVVVQ